MEAKEVFCGFSQDFFLSWLFRGIFFQLSFLWFWSVKIFPKQMLGVCFPFLFPITSLSNDRIISPILSAASLDMLKSLSRRGSSLCGNKPLPFDILLLWFYLLFLEDMESLLLLSRDCWCQFSILGLELEWELMLVRVWVLLNFFVTFRLMFLCFASNRQISFFYSLLLLISMLFLTAARGFMDLFSLPKFSCLCSRANSPFTVSICSFLTLMIEQSQLILMFIFSLSPSYYAFITLKAMLCLFSSLLSIDYPRWCSFYLLFLLGLFPGSLDRLSKPMLIRDNPFLNVWSSLLMYSLSQCKLDRSLFNQIRDIRQHCGAEWRGVDRENKEWTDWG